MKVLLITDVPPNKSFSGSLLTWHLCKNLNEKNLFGFYVMNKHLSYVKSEFPNSGQYKEKYIVKSSEASYRACYLPKRLTFIGSFIREMYRKYIEVPAYVQQALAFAKEQNADRIWVILQGQTMIWIAEQLIKKNLLPVHVQVWDSPRWWVKANQLDPFSAKVIYKSYEYVLEHSKQFGSPSHCMSQIYRDKYGRESFPLLGITPDLKGELLPVPRSPGKVIIGLAGQIYAKDTFRGLVKALDSIFWKIDGQEVEIHYWGNTSLPIYRTKIISRGYITQEKLCEELSHCDILYCPYWFDRIFEDEAKTSFPSKISTYLQSGVIIFFHGPAYSSPGSLIEQFNAGICCFSNDYEVIKFNLRQALYCEDKATKMAAAKSLVQNQLSERQLHVSFKDFIEAPVS